MPTEAALCQEAGTEPKLVPLAALIYEVSQYLLNVNLEWLSFCSVFPYFLLGHFGRYWHKECLWDRPGGRLCLGRGSGSSACLPCSLALCAVPAVKLTFCNVVILWEGEEVNASFPPPVCFLPSPATPHETQLWGQHLCHKGKGSEGRELWSWQQTSDVWTPGLAPCMGSCLSLLCLLVLGCVFYERL